LELLDRLIETYKGKPLEQFFKDLRNEIDADQDTLQDLIEKLGKKESAVRKAGAWVTENVAMPFISGIPSIRAEGDPRPSTGPQVFAGLELSAVNCHSLRFKCRATAAGRLCPPHASSWLWAARITTVHRSDLAVIVLD
jgi:hypothetical protein